MALHQLTISLTTSLPPELSLVGGKAASLVRLKQAGFPAPDGFVLTTAFFAPWAEKVKSSSEWRSACAKLESSDFTGLREACEAMKRLVASLSFTDAQRAALDGISTLMANRRLAIRSSSPEEDLSDASFAGLYKTVLNATSNTLEQAVRSCFESCLDERVLLYKREHDVDVEATSLAVIIQTQIASEISGVAFSLNPMTNDFDQTVINAAWGLGEALVSGDINPDTFVVDKVAGEILERRRGGKGGDRPDELCLSDEQLSVLTGMIKAIEDLYAFPVDVEWAFAGGGFHILQARAITAYVPLPPELLTAPGEQRLLYLDAALSKGLTINSAITPMTSSLMLRLIRLISEAVLGRKDVYPDPKFGLFGPAGARLYLNLSNILHLVNTKRQSVIDQARLTDAMIADIYESQDLEAYRPQRPPPPC